MTHRKRFQMSNYLPISIKREHGASWWRRCSFVSGGCLLSVQGAPVVRGSHAGGEEVLLGVIGDRGVLWSRHEAGRGRSSGRNILQLGVQIPVDGARHCTAWLRLDSTSRWHDHLRRGRRSSNTCCHWIGGFTSVGRGEVGRICRCELVVHFYKTRP